jgi:hypothetical protein
MTILRNSLRLRPHQNRDEVYQQIEDTQQKYAEKLAAYHYPRNAQEWWDVLQAWWPEIVAIWKQFIPIYDYYLDKTTQTPLDEVLLNMRRKRDPELEKYCHQAWLAAPDNGSIHAIPGWNVLCDLCSEANVLYDRDKQDGSRIPVPEEEKECLKDNSTSPK